MTRSGNNRKRILLVEDEPIIGNLCKRILKAEGFEVDFVQDGRKAVEATENNHYDLCVSDIRLPGITGIQLYKQLKGDQPHPTPRMIFITGDTMNMSIQSFLQESGMPCLMKPFSPDELINAVKQIPLD